MINHLILLKNTKYDGYQHGLGSTVYNFIDKKSVTHRKTEIDPENQQLADELHKPIIKKFEKRKLYSSLKDNIYLAEAQLISKHNKEI